MKWKEYRISLPVMIGLTFLIVNCSHNQRNEYSSPDLYEPVYLTDSSDAGDQMDQTEDFFYETLDRNFYGKPEQGYHSAVIQYASLTPTDQFLVSEGFPSDALSGNYSDSYYASETVVSSTWIEANASNPYIYEWAEWESVRYPRYDQPQTVVSYQIYTNYNPYDPYWFDPYWSYTRLRSYHYPFHPAYRYGGSLAFGYWYYPYYRYPYYYYPHHHPQKPRETYTAQDDRERRTGVPRNSSPRFGPSGIPSYSSALRTQSSRTVPPPSPDRIFTSPQRDAVNSMRRETLLQSGQSNSMPRIQIETNERQQPRANQFESNRQPVSQPSRSIQPTQPMRQSSGSTTSPRR
jgi:hypothetical protein